MTGRRQVPAIYRGGPKDMDTFTVQASDGVLPQEIRVIAPAAPVTWDGLFDGPRDNPLQVGKYLIVEVRRKTEDMPWFPDVQVGDPIGVTYLWDGWARA